MVDELLIEIENDMIAESEKRLSFISSDIRKKLKGIEKIVFHMWKLDSAYTGNVQLDCFDACAHSIVTLNELENAIKSNGAELAKTKDYEKALKFIVKAIIKAKKLKVRRNNNNINFYIKKVFSG